MKFLFDQNLSPRLVVFLVDLFPGSMHVHQVGLDKASDAEIWTYALNNKFIIVSKDSDFNDRSELFGSLPKIIWIRKENCSTQVIEKILRNNLIDIKAFEHDGDRSVLILF